MFSNPLVLNILDYLDLNLFRKVTINELSNTFHFNKDYLMRLFKKEIGTTIIDYMNYKRIFSSLDSKYGTDMTPFNHIYKSVDEIYEIIKDY